MDEIPTPPKDELVEGISEADAAFYKAIRKLTMFCRGPLQNIPIDVRTAVLADLAAAFYSTFIVKEQRDIAFEQYNRTLASLLEVYVRQRELTEKEGISFADNVANIPFKAGDKVGVNIEGAEATPAEVLQVYGRSMSIKTEVPLLVRDGIKVMGILPLLKIGEDTYSLVDSPFEPQDITVKLRDPDKDNSPSVQ